MIKGKWETILDEIFFIQIESPDLDVELNRERAYTKEEGREIKRRGEEMTAWRNRGEIRRPPRLYFTARSLSGSPKRDGSWI